MYKVCLVLEGLADRDHARHVAGVVADAVVRLDEDYLRAHPEAPPLLSSGVRYHPTPQGRKRPGRAYVQDVLTTLREGFGSQADLACWRIAELRAREGTAAVPLIATGDREDGGIGLRVLCLLPDGTVLDPSQGRGGIVLRDRQRITIVSGLFERDRDRKLSDRALSVLCETLTRIDEGWLTRHPEAPRIYDCPNLQYQEEPPGQEDWQDVATCLRLEKADCDDLANWCTAERRVRDGLRGARTGQRKAVRRDGGTLYHVFTEIPGRPPEDPSRILGMR